MRQGWATSYPFLISSIRIHCPCWWTRRLTTDELTVHKNKCVFFVFSKYWLYHFALASMNFFWAMNDCGSYGPSSRPPLSGGGSIERAANGFVLHWKRWDPFLSNSARCSPPAAIFCHRISPTNWQNCKTGFPRSPPILLLQHWN